MSRYNTVLFDLDGTLTDSSVGIIGCISETLKGFGIEHTREELGRYIGPPLRVCFERYLGSRAAEGIAAYRKRYNETGLFENLLYDGVTDMLRRLSGAGLTLGLATSKPVSPTLRILEHFDIKRYFTTVGAATDDGRVAEKADVVEMALAALDSADRSATVLVGDRLFDMEGALACGISAIGVLWGFGSREELGHYQPLILAEHPSQVADYLLREDAK